jgi:hypothetical protein
MLTDNLTDVGTGGGGVHLFLLFDARRRPPLAGPPKPNT